MIVPVPVCLVKCLAAITQRIIHKNQDLAVLSTAGILHLNPAGEVLGNIGPRINIMAKLQQSNAERLIKPLQSHDQVVSMIIPGDALRLFDKLRNEPGTQGSPLWRQHFEDGTGNVSMIHVGYVGQALHYYPGTYSLSGRRRIRCIRRSVIKHRIAKKLLHAHDEWQLRVANFIL